MVRRIIFILALLASAYLAYDFFRIYGAYHAVGKALPEYTITAEGADLDVVEFLDYSCKYCKETHRTLMEAITKDGHIRYIPRPLAAESADSNFAAHMAYAAAKQGKFKEMHDVLMKNYRAVTEEILPDLSIEAGADPEKIKNDSKEAEVEALLTENRRLFREFKGKATPTFIIGGLIQYVPEGHMPEVNDYLAMFEEARRMR